MNKALFDYIPAESEKQSLHQTIGTLEEHITWYKKRSDIQILENIQPTETIQSETIDLFFNNRETILKIDNEIIKKLKSDFKKMRKNDFVFQMNGKQYAYHTLLLLGFIYDALCAWNLTQNEEFLESTIAKYLMTKSGYKKLYNKYRESAFDPSTLDPNNDLIYMNIFAHLLKKEKNTKYLLNVFSLIPLHQIKFFENDDKLTKRVFNLFRYFSSARLSAQEVTLSLAIAINFYMRFKMKLETKAEINIINKFIEYVLDACFSQTLGYKISELTHNIHIAHTISFIPIFSIATKKEFYYSEYDKKHITAVMNHTQKQLGVSLDIPKEMKEAIITNPMLVYMQRLPSEIVEKI